MKVLVIEDSRFLRLAIERTLVRAGYQVTAVGDGQEGLHLAQQMSPDAILLDMMLPTLEGTEVLRLLKKDAVTKRIPIIVLSGLSQKNEKKLKTAGAAAYFEKSKLDLQDDSGTLVEAVRRLFGEPGCEDQHDTQTTDRATR